jgi:hypothetical protein
MFLLLINKKKQILLKEIKLKSKSPTRSKLLKIKKRREISKLRRNRLRNLKYLKVPIKMF